MLTCINCNNTSSIKYNELDFCNNCLEDMKNRFNEFENNHKKEYKPPTKIDNNLYVGSVNSIIEPDKLKALSINKIIIAGKRLFNENHKNFEYLEHLIDDSLEQDIKKSILLTNNYIDNNPNSIFLIHCYSGISRSCSLVIGYLMHKYKWDYDTAYNYVNEKHTKCHPNSNFEKQLRLLSTKFINHLS